MLDEMRMRTACFARAPQRCTSRLSKHLLLTFQEVTPLSKTRNQLNLSLCLRLLPQQMAHLDELACGKAPLLGEQCETDPELRWQRPSGDLLSIPVAAHPMPLGSAQPALMQLDFDLAGPRGAMLNALRAGPRE